MKGYLAILKSRIFVLIQYRAAALAGLATQFFWGLIKVMILAAFYSETTITQPLSLAQAFDFIWIGQALLLLLPWTIDKELEEQVKSGNIGYELVRPLDLYSLFFFRSLAMRVAPTIMRAIPVFLIAGLFINLSSPISTGAAIAFTFSLILSALLSAAITTIVIISLFWTLSGEGIVCMLAHVVLFLSGLVVPLPLFPNWAQPILNIQPFRFIIDVPCRLYTGIIPVSEAAYYLTFQVMWILLFVIAGRVLINRAVKKFVMQGG